MVTLTTSGPSDSGATSALELDTGAFAQVAALLHEARRTAPDEVGRLLADRAENLGLLALSVYVTDYEQRHLVPIAGSHDARTLDIEESAGGLAFRSGRQLEEPVAEEHRLWSVVIDGAAALGVMSVVVEAVDDATRALADSLAGVVAALLVTRGECTDAYTVLRRTRPVTLAAEMQWQLLPPLSIESGRVSVAGLIHPAYEVGGDAFDYAINGRCLDFAIFDAMGHGLESSQLAHLAVTAYRHSRRAGLGLADTFVAVDGAVAAFGEGERFVTCLLGRLDLDDGRLTWVNGGHPRPFLVRQGELVGQLPCDPTLPLGLGSGRVDELAHEVLLPGDRLCCITDGVLDAHRPGGDDFGEERLAGFLSHDRGALEVSETVRQLTHAVLDHHSYLSDDTTVFLIEFR